MGLSLTHNNKSVIEKKNEKLLQYTNDLSLEDVPISPPSSNEPGGCKNPMYVIEASKARITAYASIDFCKFFRVSSNLFLRSFSDSLSVGAIV
ncbi:unnamed protein product [Sphagnum jensenii]|uniref:Uncharacterized protein n=1 Tax=Sphagnum jensenii TaxID=128206 RepID=A0ABP1AQM5_9BRYO